MGGVDQSDESDGWWDGAICDRGRIEVSDD